MWHVGFAASQPPSHIIMPLKSNIHVLDSALCLTHSTTCVRQLTNDRHLPTVWTWMRMRMCVCVYLSIYLNIRVWRSWFEIVRNVCISKRSDYDICLECSMKMNDLRMEKKHNNGCFSGNSRLFNCRRRLSFNSNHCTLMNAYTFLSFNECYYSQEIEAERYAVSSDYFQWVMCLHPFASRSSFELHFNPFLSNIHIPMEIDFNFDFYSCFVFFVHALEHPTSTIYERRWMRTMSIVCKRAVRSNIIWNEELCENTHIYYKKALEPWLRIVCLKTNMEKGLFVFAICGYFFIPYPVPNATHLPLLNVAHIWTTVCEYEFIHNHFILFVAFRKNKYACE